jgi:hypothetical protein
MPALTLKGLAGSTYSTSIGALALPGNQGSAAASTFGHCHGLFARGRSGAEIKERLRHALLVRPHIAARRTGSARPAAPRNQRLAAYTTSRARRRPPVPLPRYCHTPRPFGSHPVASRRHREPLVSSAASPRTHSTQPFLLGFHCNGRALGARLTWRANWVPSMNVRSALVIDLQKVRKRRDPKVLEVPLVSRLLATAERWQREIDRGEVRNRAAIARREGVSQAHVGHILDLLRLHPDIRAAVAALPAGTSRRVVSERMLRRLTRVPWRRQLAELRWLLHPSANTA